MIALQLYQAVLYGSTTGQLGLEVSAEFLKIDLMGIYTLDHGYLLSIPALLNLDSYSLLFLGNLLTDAELPRKATDSAHFRTHCVAVTSTEYKTN